MKSVFFSVKKYMFKNVQLSFNAKLEHLINFHVFKQFIMMRRVQLRLSKCKHKNFPAPQLSAAWSIRTKQPCAIS